MKGKRIMAVAFAQSMVLLSLAMFHLPAYAQKPQRYSADTGIVSLGSDQIMRITVNAGHGDDALTVLFRQIGYQPMTEQQGITRLSPMSQSTSGPITLAPGEAASLELSAGTYGRGIISTSSSNARVTIHVVNKYTNHVDSILIALLLP